MTTTNEQSAADSYHRAPKRRAEVGRALTVAYSRQLSQVRRTQRNRALW